MPIVKLRPIYAQLSVAYTNLSLLLSFVYTDVSVHAKKTADRQIDNETNDRNKMKDYKREISLHAFS